MHNNISRIRKEYILKDLSLVTVNYSPVAQFRNWLDEAITAGVNEPTAMTLATAGLNSHPSARIVLLKDFSEKGLSFYTNYQSKKGWQLSQNPNAALLFFWPEIERQVRFEGQVEKLPDSESDLYFSTRPTESKIGAWASNQSGELPSRENLKNEVDKFTRRFKNQNIPRPYFWGGYRFVPGLIEFWQGRPGRLHDRIQYEMQRTKWIISRLSP